MKKNDIQKNRIWAVQRFFNGEKPSSICASLGRPRSWLYNWIKRYIDGDNSWSESLSRRPLNNPKRTPKEVEEIVRCSNSIFTTEICSAVRKQYAGRWKIWTSSHCRRFAPSTAFSAEMVSPTAEQVFINPRVRRIQSCHLC